MDLIEVSPDPAVPGDRTTVSGRPLLEAARPWPAGPARCDPAAVWPADRN